MQTIGKFFLKGLAVGIPIILTLAILWWLAVAAERRLGQLLRYVLLDDWYLPGMGLLAGIILVILVGMLSQVLIFQKLFTWGERLLARVPLVKTVYPAIRDFVNYFSRGGQGEFNRVALVNLPGQEFKMVGFITRDDFTGLNLPAAINDKIAVYLPMSYQIGGYTLYLPVECVEPMDISFEDAMRLTLTGGVAAASKEITTK